MYMGHPWHNVRKLDCRSTDQAIDYEVKQLSTMKMIGMQISIQIITIKIICNVPPAHMLFVMAIALKLTIKKAEHDLSPHLLVNRSSDRSCTRGMFHNKFIS